MMEKCGAMGETGDESVLWVGASVVREKLPVGDLEIPVLARVHS